MESRKWERISIINDRWIGIDDLQRVEQVNLLEFPATRVNELIDAEKREWKNEMVESIFDQTDGTKSCKYR